MKITITGPRSVGKSTISKLLAKKLKLKYISSDEIGEKHTQKYGGLDKAIKSGKIKEMIEKEGYSLIKKVYEKDNFVFDLSGGSISSKKYETASKEIKEIVKKNPIIIGLLPEKNTKESIKFLFEREKEREHFKKMKATELLEKVDRNYKRFPPLFKTLCNKTIYVKDKTQKEIVEEINFYIQTI
jgi:shikimate kinase